MRVAVQRSTAGTLIADQKGQALVVTAMSLMMLLGLAALTLDVSYMYDKRNELHAAADAAAKVGAIELRRDSSLSNAVLKQFADEQVKNLGFTPAACGASSGTSVCVNKCPATGPFSFASIGSSCNSFVEAVVSQPSETFFARVLGRTKMTPAARSVAGVSPGPNCLVVFDHVKITSSATGSLIDMGGCSLIINGQGSPTTDLDNRGVINARTIGVVHTGAAGCQNNCSNVTYGVPPASDPLATLPALAAPAGATCTSKFNITAATTITTADINKYYCGWNFNGGSLTLGPGNYYVNGDITAESPGTDVSISGTGVMIFLTTAAKVNLVSNHVSLTMTAPTSGTYSGILLYQDRATPNYQAVFGKNTTDLAIRGAFYFPTATIEMKNENSATLTNPCMVIVAWAIEVDKPNFLLNNACLGFSGSPLMSLSLVE